MVSMLDAISAEEARQWILERYQAAIHRGYKYPQNYFPIRNTASLTLLDNRLERLNILINLPRASKGDIPPHTLENNVGHRIYPL